MMRFSRFLRGVLLVLSASVLQPCIAGESLKKSVENRPLQTLIVNLVSKDGTPAKNVRCLVHPKNPNPKQWISGERGRKPVRRTRTRLRFEKSDENGRIKLQGQGGQSFSLEISDRSSSFFGEKTIVFPSEESAISEIEFKLKNYLELSGRVLNKSGDPVSGMNLDLLAPSGSASHGGSHKCIHARTGKNGEFRFNRIRLGRELFVSGTDLKNYQLDRQTVELGQPVVLVATKYIPPPPEINCRLIDENDQRIGFDGIYTVEGEESFHSTGIIKKGEFKLSAHPEGKYELIIKKLVGGRWKEQALYNHSFELPSEGNALEFELIGKDKGVRPLF